MGLIKKMNRPERIRTMIISWRRAEPIMTGNNSTSTYIGYDFFGSIIFVVPLMIIIIMNFRYSDILG